MLKTLWSYACACLVLLKHSGGTPVHAWALQHGCPGRLRERLAHTDRMHSDRLAVVGGRRHTGQELLAAKLAVQEADHEGALQLERHDGELVQRARRMVRVQDR